MNKIYLIILSIVIFVIVLRCGKTKTDTVFSTKTDTVFSTKTDTVFSTKTDTVFSTKPIFIENKVVDTFFVYVNDSTNIALPIEQKRYAEPDKYELYVSGVNPKLDTIRVFNKTEYRTVTNTVTNTVYNNAWRGYISGQITTFDGYTIPSIGLTIASPKSLLIGGSVGLYNNKPTYQLSVGYKMF